MLNTWNERAEDKWSESIFSVFHFMEICLNEHRIPFEMWLIIIKVRFFLVSGNEYLLLTLLIGQSNYTHWFDLMFDANFFFIREANNNQKFFSYKCSYLS